MRINEILLEFARQSLYHAVDIERAVEILQRGSFVGAGIQRYWKDGRRRNEDDPDYNTSYWMKGISTTRDRRFAENWRDVVFELDWNKIIHVYKVIPYSWSFHLSRKWTPVPDHKREREEFIVTSFTKKTSDDYQELKRQHKKDMLIDMPEGKDIPLSYCLGFTINENVFEYRKFDDPILRQLGLHPLFSGFFKDTRKKIGNMKVDANIIHQRKEDFLNNM